MVHTCTMITESNTYFISGGGSEEIRLLHAVNVHSSGSVSKPSEKTSFTQHHGVLPHVSIFLFFPFLPLTITFQVLTMVSAAEAKFPADLCLVKWGGGIAPSKLTLKMHHWIPDFLLLQCLPYHSIHFVATAYYLMATGTSHKEAMPHLQTERSPGFSLNEVLEGKNHAICSLDEKPLPELGTGLGR